MAGEQAYGGGPERAGPGDGDTTVVDLLVAQCEIADVVLLNKVDLTAALEEVDRIEAVVRALNPRARVLRSERGRVAPAEVLAVAQGRGAALAGVVDDHKDLVQAASVAGGDHSHTHQHGDAADEHHTVESACDGPASSHSHDPHGANCADPSCTDPSHSHSHDHPHHACSDPDCTDPSHAHDHPHACDDPDCSDPSHAHDHNRFAHGSLGTFVYRARRPFHPGRLARLLQYLPVTQGLPPMNGLPALAAQSAITDTARKLLGNLLRSKGFVWCASSDEAAMFWSHAGTSFEMSCLGRWWATLDRAQWPPEAAESILQDFDDPHHDETDPNLKTVGDRRQEVVFIGPDLGSGESQRLLENVLNECLLEDDEWKTYCTKRTDGRALTLAFVSPFEVKMMTY